jgi:hypothetical protein
MGHTETLDDDLPKTPKDDPDRVWITTYSHEHGLDVWVNRTAEGTRKALARAMEEYIDEYTGDAAQLRRLLAKGDIGKAVLLWARYRNEYFDIEQHTMGD